MTTTNTVHSAATISGFKSQTLFDYRDAVLAPKRKSPTPVEIEKVTVLQLELFSLGYRLTPKAFKALSWLSSTAFSKEAKRLKSTIEKRLGNNVEYHVLYSGFPDDVPDFDAYVFFRFFSYVEEFFGINQTGETLQCGHQVDSTMFNALDFGACPICQMQDKSLLKDSGGAFKQIQNRLDFLKANNVKLRDIGTASAQDFDDIVRNILRSSSSITTADEKVLGFVFSNFMRPDIEALLPVEFGFKEVMAQAVALYANRFGKNDTMRVFRDSVKTPQDVLRIAKMFRDLSVKEGVEAEGKTLLDGFIHSAEGFGNKMSRVKYKLNNTQRKTVVALLDNIDNPLEGMFHDRMEWVHLNKSVHFGQFKSKYPNAFAATDTLFNRPETIKTFESIYEELLQSGDVKALCKHLSTRGGMFGRVLDKVLRQHEDRAVDVLSAFEKVGDDISMRVLLSLHNVFASRANEFNERIYVDSDTGKVKVLDELRKPLDMSVNVNALHTVTRMIASKLKVDGKVSKVVIDPVLSNFKVPVKMRNTDQGIVKSERGSSVKIDANHTVTAFTYWKETEESDRVDLDLSVTLYGHDFKRVESCYYHDHNRHGYCMTHSGDLQSAPNGAAEMIKIDLSQAKAKGARYAVVFVNSFTNSPFSSFEAFTGVMADHCDNDASKFNPLAVKDRIDLTGSGKNVVSAIYDLKEGKLITTNMVTDGFTTGNYDSYSDATETILRFIVNEEKVAMNLHDYFLEFANINGAEVHKEANEGEEYDYVFDFETSQNIDEFNANWL